MNVSGRIVRAIRYAVQGWFLLFCVFVAYRFVLFVRHFEEPGRIFAERPSSIDGFLPIAGLISFKHAVLTGTIEPFHPAAFWIFTAVLAISLVFKKGFCGWICPVGTLSQWVWMTGEKVFGRNFRIWRALDLPLRSSKYLLMGFFLFVIVIKMSPGSVNAFFSTDYYKVADVKTVKFFTDMSSSTIIVLAALGGFSVIYKNFWCRYLCPYGALLGIMSFFSPVKVRREESRCVHCHACTKNCPSHIDVEKQAVVRSPECFGCLGCVSRCPSIGALEVSVGAGGLRRSLPPLLYAVALLVVFYLVIAVAMATGAWKSGVPYQEYVRILGSGISTLSHP